MSSHDKLIQITMPSQTNAALAGEDYEEYKVKMESAFDIDYEALEAECQKRIDSFTSDKLICVRYTPGSVSGSGKELWGTEFQHDTGKAEEDSGESNFGGETESAGVTTRPAGSSWTGRNSA